MAHRIVPRTQNSLESSGRARPCRHPVCKAETSGSIDAEVLAARDDFSLWRAGTTGVLNIGPIGGTAGNIWRLTVARYKLSTPTLSSVDGILKHTLPFMAASQPADVEGTTDPVTLAFT